MEEAIKVIDNEYLGENNKIFIHTTEGRKTTSLALLFAAYRRKDKIEGAYYITEEEHEIIKLPLLDFNVNETQKFLLKEISNGNSELKVLQKKAKLKQSAIYQNIQELKQEGYITEDKEPQLTELGRAMIL